MKYDLTKDVQWSTTCGIELTFVPDEHVAVFDRHADDWLALDTGRVVGMYALSSTLRTSHYSRRDSPSYDRCSNRARVSSRLQGFIGVDPQVVEHSSPILRSWTHARRWYHHAVGRAAQVGLTTFREDHVGGGGHIHLGSTLEQAHKMLCDSYYRPYLAWACLSPFDEYNAKPAHRAGFELTRLVTHRQDILKATDWSSAHTAKTALSETQCVGFLRPQYRYETVEWRAFDSAADWSIQECQLALALRYHQYVGKNDLMSLPCKGQRAKSVIHLLNDFSLVTAERDFREFITHDLELPWKSYSWMVERNLQPRVKKFMERGLTNFHF